MEDSDINKYKDWLDMQKGLARNISPKPPDTNADSEYTIIGKIINSRIINTKKGQHVAFLQLADYWGSMDLVVFPKILEEKGIDIKINEVMAFFGKIDSSREDTKFLVDNIIRPEKMKQFHNSKVHQMLKK